MNAIVARSRHEPPAALPRAPSNAMQLLSIAAGPVLWNAQLVANYALANYPCFPHAVARTVPLPGWEHSWFWLLAINLGAIALSVVAFGVGLYCMRWARRQSLSDERHARVIGRTYAFGVAGMLFSATFFIATVFTLIAIVGAPQCTG
jgi:hypothetical protein